MGRSLFLLALVGCGRPDAPPLATPDLPRPEPEVPARGPDLPDPRPATETTPALCINEISPANRVSARDEAGLAADWIELHNPTDADVRLAGWTIADASGEHGLHPSLVVEAHSYLVLWADDAPDRGPDHLPFSLSADGDEVALYAPDGSGTVVHFGPVSGDLTIARRTDCCVDDGASCFGYLFAGTPGASNDGY